MRVAAPEGFALEGGTDSDILRIPLRAGPHPLLDLRAAAIVAREAPRYDLIHAHGLRGAWIGALAARRSGIPLVFTAHNLAPRNPGRVAVWALRFTAAKSAAIVAVSSAVADSLTPCCPESKIVVIPNGIDIALFDAPPPRADIFRAFDIPDDLRVIVAVGRVAPEKGFAHLIDAAPKVLSRFPGACFVLAGDGPERQSLIGRIRQKGLEGRFFLVGRIEDVPGLLAASDMVVIPSLTEGHGLIALEAMAAGKPVVAARVGGLCETIIEGETGLLIAPGEPEAISDSILRLLWDESLRLRLGNAGRKRARQGYSIEQMVESTVDMYAQVSTGRT